jgi:hypothetical protein
MFSAAFAINQSSLNRMDFLPLKFSCFEVFTVRRWDELAVNQSKSMSIYELTASQSMSMFEFLTYVKK